MNNRLFAAMLMISVLSLYGSQSSVLITKKPSLFRLSASSIWNAIQKHPKLMTGAGLSLLLAAAWKYKLSDVSANRQLAEDVWETFLRYENQKALSNCLLDRSGYAELLNKYIKFYRTREMKIRAMGSGRYTYGAKLSPGDYRGPIRPSIAQDFVRGIVGDKNLSKWLLVKETLDKDFQCIIDQSDGHYFSNEDVNMLLILTQRALARRKLKELYPNDKSIYWGCGIYNNYFLEILKERYCS